MTATTEYAERFWSSMSERYGRRWFDEMGAAPTTAWKALLGRYTPEVCGQAMDRLKNRSDANHPPTLPVFESLLSQVSAEQARLHHSGDFTRDHWRSVIISTCLRHAALLSLCPHGETQVLNLSSQVRAIAVDKCRELLDWACETERRTGQRTPGIEQHVNAELWNALKPFGRAAMPGTAAARGELS